MIRVGASWRSSGPAGGPGGILRFLLVVALLPWLLSGSMPAAEEATRSGNPPQGAAPAAPKNLDDLKALEEQIRRVAERVRPCTVGVADGSGVVVSEDGYVLTVAHVGERAGRNVRITFPDGRRVRGRTLGNDHGMDAGLVKITTEGKWPFVEMGRSGSLKPGQWCLAVGYPVSFDRRRLPPIRIGRVLRRNSSMLVTDCTIMGGDSGGPLFDLEGKLIGIGSRCSDPVTVNLYVPVDTFHDSWDRLAKGEDFDSLAREVAFLGVSPEANEEAPRIGRVIAGSPAEKAGLKPGDVVLKFDGRLPKQYADLRALLRKKKPEDKVQLQVRRGEETLDLTVTLDRREE